jgi:heterogeneous nuclear ribonucleoprotein F/H
MVRRDGRLSGEAFVVLALGVHVELALSKNRSYLGRRYIEVYRAKKAVRARSLAPMQSL